MKITTAIISIMMVMLSLPSLHSQEPVRPAFLKEPASFRRLFLILHILHLVETKVYALFHFSI